MRDRAWSPRRMVRFMRHEAWSDALFVSWAVDAERLAQHLPPGIRPDTLDGRAYVSVVALTESDIMPWPPGIPLWLARLLRLSHHAVNVRTYVRPETGDGPPGIFFFSLECSSLLPTVGASLLFNLPYRYAAMARSGPSAMKSERRSGDRPVFHASWRPAEAISPDDALAAFLVERYSLYNEPSLLLRLLQQVSRAAATCLGRSARGRARYWRGSITHEPWSLRAAELDAFSSDLCEAAGLGPLVNGSSPVLHCSQGVGPVDFYFDGMF